MRKTIAIVIGMLCLASAALAECPTITATVTTSGSTVTYNYRLTNNTPDDVWGFYVAMPAAAADAIISTTTSQNGWDTQIRKAAFTMVSWWYWPPEVPGPKIAPGDSADFSFTTAVGVPTTNSYTEPGSGSNWSWYGTFQQAGNTILPVPAPVPEPSSIAALGVGLLPLGTCLLRKRRQRN